MDIKKIKELIDVVDGYSGIELTLDFGDKKLTVSSSDSNKKKLTQYNIETKLDEEQSEYAGNNIRINSPYVGIAKLSENGKNYFAEDQILCKGDLICKIDSCLKKSVSKTEPPSRGKKHKKNQPLNSAEPNYGKNEIRAEYKLKVVGCFVEDGDIVEYDTPLFVVEKIE